MMAEETREQRRCRAQWQALSQTGLTLAALQTFYARYKYLVMSRDLNTYRAIGGLLAAAEKNALPAVAQRLFASIMAALAKPPTRGGDINALLHIAGYLKKQLQPEEKRELLAAVEKYRGGEVALEVPVALLRAHFQRFPNPYIEQQEFLQPQGEASLL